MGRGKAIVVGVGIFAVAFVAGSIVRVDQSAAARRVRMRIEAIRGPRFPAGDTLVVADTLHARCGALQAKPKLACYNEQLLALRQQRGTRFAMGTLNRLNALDRGVAFSGHEYAHAIGIAAYKDSLDVSGAFQSCTEILQSGCYHGVIETYLLSVPKVGAQEVNAVCQAWRAPDADRWLRFQCVHGMGHGLEMFLAHDLPKALEGCDLLDDEWDRKSCYGGAFMENVVFATDPSMAQMVMGDAPGGHQMEMPGMTKFKMIDRADPYYPCNAVGAKYQEDCWMMQPAVMLQIYDGDFEKTFRACDGAPPEWRATCYQGTGTEISGAVLMDHHDAIMFCSRGGERWRPWCYEGVVKNFIDVTAKSTDGLAFCREVPERAGQLKCYQSVGEEIAVMRNTLDARRPMCEVITGDAAARDACLYGAQILPAPPRGTPTAD
jgi:hypothetical protein